MKSDLGVRTLSAIVMLAAAGGALWLGNWYWASFVAAIALAVLWEWWALVRGIADGVLSRFFWIAGGVVYVALASAALMSARYEFEGVIGVLLIVGVVIATDIGAYFAGRMIGGPKIAPTISPNKTWAGLVGGMIGATAAYPLISWSWYNGLCKVFYPPPSPSDGLFYFDGPCSGIVGILPTPELLLAAVIVGPLVALVAQAGDFFESWMKRKAGVKDSSNVIPGHGGLFDRVDGLLAVSFVGGVLMLVDKAI